MRAAAALTGAQVHPFGADLDAFFARVFLRVENLRYTGDVSARSAGHVLFSSFLQWRWGPIPSASCRWCLALLSHQIGLSSSFQSLLHMIGIRRLHFTSALGRSINDASR